jgi:hypothetical protein
MSEKADIKACEAAISVGYGDEAQRRERLLQPFDARIGVLRTSLRYLETHGEMDTHLRGYDKREVNPFPICLLILH